MRGRHAVGLALTILGLAGSAAAQEGWEEVDRGAAGSFTIVSSPPGVVVHLRDDRIELSGRTPWTVSRGLHGVFDVEAEQDGFESWSRKIFLNPATSDTLRIELTPKQRFWAGLRSLVFPGWGQRYSGRGGASVGFFLAEVAAGVGAVLTDVRYWDRQDDLDTAYAAYAATDIQSEREARWLEVERRRRIAADASDDRNLALILLGAVHATNFLDAILFFPDRARGGYTAGRQLFATPNADGVDVGVQFRY